MDSIQIYGEVPLYGQLKVQGSKNAALPILAATVLVPGVSVLHNCPAIEDVRLMCKLLENVGCNVSWKGNTVIVDASGVKGGQMPAEYVEKMRSSVIFMGSMLGRTGEVSLKYPGGCVIGKRPIDLHLRAMEQLGVETVQSEEGIYAKVSGLAGNTITFPIFSVGATENTILAAINAEGTTVLRHAAREPEIQALCGFLRQAGADIYGDGSETICINGQKPLHACEYEIPADRIVAGTYLLAVMAAGGEICLQGARRKELRALLTVLERMGAELHFEESGERSDIGKAAGAGQCIVCRRENMLLPAGDVVTESYPGYPTDLQSPLLAVMTLANGRSTMTETIFENRFRVVEELNRMGAGITVQGQTAFVPGAVSGEAMGKVQRPRKLYGTAVTAGELRGGAALVLAGLAAKGMTSVYGRKFIDRGYENIVRDLRALGAKVFYEEENGKDGWRIKAAAGKDNRIQTVWKEQRGI